MKRILSTVCLLSAAAICASCGSNPDPPVSGNDASLPVDLVDLDSIRPQVVAFCADCHGMPSPASFPKEAWHEEVERGYNFHFASGRTDVKFPPMKQVVDFFRRQAPEKLDLGEVVKESSPAKLTFRQEQFRAEPGTAAGPPPAIADVNWVQLDEGRPHSLIYCNMRSGWVSEVTRIGDSWTVKPLGRLDNPAHAEPCDLDEDGRIDLVVADLGSFLPEDHDRGRVVWLRRGEGEREFEPIVVLKDVGRVADVRPGDFDGDGHPDLIVAEFGWQKTGSITLLLSRWDNGRFTGKFDASKIDARHGTIHVPPVDFDNDGDLDFVALISQEYEDIEVFLNRGDGTFDNKAIHSVEDPAYGSSGIQLVDLDGDDDLDVLYANGDTFDSFYIKPYHGVQWLENRGEFPFVAHHLTFMPGVHRALAADMDGDGDQDVVAVALLPNRLLAGKNKGDFESVIWLEQTSRGEFVRRRLEAGTCDHAAFELADFDGNGRPDLAIGNFVSGDATSADMTIWWNEPTLDAE